MSGDPVSKARGCGVVGITKVERSFGGRILGEVFSHTEGSIDVQEFEASVVSFINQRPSLHSSNKAGPVL